jgi:uncharacterized membrane protein
MAPSFERSIHSMGTVYTLFKFLHIVGAIVWIGGVISVNIISVRIAREKDGAALAAISRQSRFYGMAIIGPAAGLTLLAGIVMIAVSGLSVPLWIAWGLAAILVSMGLGATLIRRAGEELSQLAATATPGDSRLSALQQRLSTLNIVNVLVLLSAVWAMVFKPTL